MLTFLLKAFSNVSAWNASNAGVGQDQLADRWWSPGEDHALKIGIITALGCLIILGNSFVLFVIASSVSGWSRNSRYILISLTGTDVTLALIVVPLNLYGSLALEPGEEDEGESPIGPYCHIVAFINSSVFASSIYSLATISLERYIAVFFPLHYNRVMSRRRVKILIAAAWLLPPIFLFPISIPGGTVIRVYFSRASLICNPDYASNMGYSLLLTTVIFFPCSAIVTFANLRLWLVARRQSRRMSVGWAGRTQTIDVPTVCSRVTQSSIKRTTGNMCTVKEFRDKGPRRGDPASRVLVPVVIVFYMCWTPCMVTILYNAITRERVQEWVEFVALWLPSGNGFLNCFVYFWINKSFRQKFRQLGRKLCLWGCSHSQTKPPKHSATTVYQLNCMNNSPVAALQERSCSMTSTCMLLPQPAGETIL
ncbi:D(4) dopamine receptor-like [Spea bombifrons]|uniref:D(4) dopamine receptor-like n=1 Tax=Spea bombifrons TaxID=233779 RepID=UPI00234AB453|nr:D(4) dopamine receptor-like [Spea bombifrons]